jgi:hypothetical protein
VLEAKLLANMYVLDITNKVVTSNSKETSKSYILYNNYNKQILEQIKLYHERFGHKNISTICKLLNIQVPSNYTLDCVACIKAKAVNKISREVTLKPLQYLDKVVIDICSPITPVS